jgi:S1-C subfamily serine protease
MFTKISTLKQVIIAAFLISVVAGGITGGAVGLYVARTTPAPSGAPQPSGSITQPAPVTGNTNAPDDLTATVKRVLPSVVSIVISKEVSTAPAGNMFNVGPFSFDFGGNSAPSDGSAPTEKRKVGGGSGFIVSADGLIVTNRHVVEDTQATYSVKLNDGRTFDATVLARDPLIDLALIKIDAKNLPAVTLGDSDKLALGQTVIAIGNALGEFQNTVTRGIVSGTHRRIVAGGTASGSEVIEEAIQTDAAINPGNSGGPLIAADGTVVGVNTAVSQQGQSVGFAIPMNIARQTIESVQKTGSIVRPYLGVRYVLIDADLSKKNQLPVDYGALVVRGDQRGELAIVPGSPADKAGIVENDIILEADGQKVDADHPLSGVVIRHKVGDTVSFKLYHKGDTTTVKVTLVEIPKQ